MSNLPAPATKIDRLLALDKITPNDIESLNDAERDDLAATATQIVAQLKGAERDDFLEKIDLIVPASTKSDIWAYNHALISRAVANYMRANGVMPAQHIIVRETGLSRQTVSKHLKEYKHHPEHAAQMEQFKFMAPSVLANVFKYALDGDMRAARLYFQMVGATNAQRHDYATSMVMFVPGWAKEARRLGRDTGIRMISPVDGLRPAQLRGSKLVLLLGS